MRKDIPGYEGRYQADTEGYIFSVRSKKKLKPWTINGGYQCVGLSTSGTAKTYLVHRLIAFTFLPNEHNLREVNHKDENKTNNRIENLEWCTSSYNKRYGTFPTRVSAARKGKFNLYGCKPVRATRISDGVSCDYPSINEAERILGISHSNIVAHLKGRLPQTNGYTFMYLEGE